MKNILKAFGNLDRRAKFPLLIIVLAAIIGLSMAACDLNGDKGGNDKDNNDKSNSNNKGNSSGKGTSKGGSNDSLKLFGNVILEMKFNEKGDWNEPGHDDWARWESDYQDKNEVFDLSGMLDDKKVYILKYSFSSNINIDRLTSVFYNMDDTYWDWKAISNYGLINRDINKNTKYSGKIALIPNSNAELVFYNEFTFMKFEATNRNISTPAVLYFYQFDLEQVDREDSLLDEWFVSGKKFEIDTSTFAEELADDFQGKSNVIHIKPCYDTGSYGDFVIKYDLEAYAEQTINIVMYMNVYLSKPTRIAWQINSIVPYYPVICGVVSPDPNSPNPNSGPVMSANKWHFISGSNEITVPAYDDKNDRGRILYLSGYQIEGIEAYFTDVTIAIIPK